MKIFRVSCTRNIIILGLKHFLTIFNKTHKVILVTLMSISAVVIFRFLKIRQDMFIVPLIVRHVRSPPLEILPITSRVLHEIIGRSAAQHFTSYCQRPLYFKIREIYFSINLISVRPDCRFIVKYTFPSKF